MYVKKVQITNYGPIEALDIVFPFAGGNPKPIVLVGANGSGKSIFLSHIINAMISAQQQAYPGSPEVEADKVYKLRGPDYVRTGAEFSFARVEFVDAPPAQELVLLKKKQDYQEVPEGISGTEAQESYNVMKPADSSIFHDNLNERSTKSLFDENCILYFPPNRFEEPAWLNEGNLISKAQYMDLSHMEGYSNRPVINYSPLRRNRDWLFDVVYDFSVFERKDTVLPVRVDDKSKRTINVSASIGYAGAAKQLYDSALRVVQKIVTSGDNLRLGIGKRHNRTVSVMQGNKIIVPNVFQLSTGEVSLLNLFLSVLRDHDLARTNYTGTDNIRGIVVVDEIDLHLHAKHQHDVLPRLMAMFPKIQFVVTSHSPLFVLGLRQVLGEDGFALFNLPEGRHLSAEGFGEFGEAYRAFIATQKHAEEVRAAVKDAQRPLIFVEGLTDVLYLTKAVELLGFQDLVDVAEFREGGGDTLKNVWRGLTRDHVEREKVVVLHDPESTFDDTRGNVFRRSMCGVSENPIEKGIENLFSRETLVRARAHSRAFIDVDGEQKNYVRGQQKTVPERWTVNTDEKTNLCNWLCEHGTVEDYEHFRPTLEMLNGILGGVSVEDQ